MSTPYQQSMAVIALPAISGGQIKSPVLRRWLSRSNLRRATEPTQLLGRILHALNLPYPDAGLGALRMWGQTGDRPTVWIAAADPIYLEARLDHLCLHALGSSGVPTSDLRPLFDHLQRTLVDNANYGFARVGSRGYLRAAEPIATANVSPEVVDQQRPNEFMPSGDGADGYRSLISEVEMSLHDHEVNLRRQEQGLFPINCLWLWGGGFAPERHTMPHPPLFCNDPLIKGHWLSKTGAVRSWPGTIDACLDSSVAGFVAVAPEDDDQELLEHCLGELCDAMRSGRLGKLELIFRDGSGADVQRAQRWRFWRRTAADFE